MEISSEKKYCGERLQAGFCGKERLVPRLWNGNGRAKRAQPGEVDLIKRKLKCPAKSKGALENGRK